MSPFGVAPGPFFVKSFDYNHRLSPPISIFATELTMPHKPPTIPNMRVLSRSILVCALVLLQLASASGHVLHHALEGAVPERHDCADAACGMDQDSATPCHHDSDTDSPFPHDCSDCFLCDASDAQIAQATQQQRPIEDVAATCFVTGVIESDGSADPARRLPPAPPPPHPATLHAVTLPLLD